MYIVLKKARIAGKDVVPGDDAGSLPIVVANVLISQGFIRELSKGEGEQIRAEYLAKQAEIAERRKAKQDKERAAKIEGLKARRAALMQEILAIDEELEGVQGKAPPPKQSPPASLESERLETMSATQLQEHAQSIGIKGQMPHSKAKLLRLIARHKGA